MAAPGTSGMIATLRELQHSLNTSMDQFVATAEKSGVDSVEFDKAQATLFSLSSKLVAETVNPVNAILQFVYMPSVNAAVRTAIDLDLFALASRPVTVEEVANKAGADQTLILRLMRVLAAFHFLDEVAKGRYQSTKLAQVLAIPALRDWIKVNFDVIFKTFQNIPSYLAKTGYQNPSNVTKSVMHDTFGYGFFEYLQHHPDHLANFNSSMKISEAFPPPTTPNYPYMTELRAAPQQDPDAVTLVDLGGGRGQFIEALMAANPDLPGRFILQDTPHIVDNLDRSSLGFEAMVHDFFTPQPIPGARWYHLRRVLHDWPDAECHKILRSTATACKRGYSTLLITESVLPDSGCGQVEAVVDLTMMVLNGMERSEAQWRELLGAAGFRIVNVWRAEMGSTATIEAELAD